MIVILATIILLAIIVVSATALIWQRQSAGSPAEAPAGAPAGAPIDTPVNGPAYEAPAYSAAQITVDDLVPAGTVWAFSNNQEVPHGWVACEGQALHKIAYGRLYAAIGLLYTSNGISRAGRDYFDLPDMRGAFLRGVDDGAGVDPGRALGTYQADGLPDHYHPMTYYSNTIYDGIMRDYVYPFPLTTREQPVHYPADPPATREMTGGAGETRPANVALLYCIKT